ncbi:MULTISPECIES: alpha/beta hydrolase [Shewanella]|jgi:acetyl esterase/lipase|uniref:alpha/beta hydrolase n=1 Tax=Shewanella TaxID=22 RepID=UPI001558C278|nr:MULTISPECIES: alpha/beta hydrolase [Shewanella]MDH0447206.1 alpha/beta hydrolase [Shewanella sp. GD04112]MDI5837028.1 alpha/beta hydrolase [Shewanella xiamenensis]MDI5841311.1 alpha/beta hydrolase [Shewanella xiamenensis]MDI5844972.1 alpha/beta hydrolase [Shewanella xiamenensis]MDI5848973.1 alpha/beta hydrolase [Shewanella xiamenensis]
MPSWQASVLNTILSYVARPSISRGKAKLPLSQVRQRLLELDKRWLPWPEKLVTASIPLQHSTLLHYVLLNDTPRLGNLFYIRGGGFCFKTPHAHARLVADISERCRLDTFIPDYRLAPEHPYPAPCDDVLEAYLHLIELKGSDNLVLMGDSAGGNLALSLLLELKKRHLPMPKACVLLSPALDLAITGDTELILGADDPFFTIESLLRLRGAYLAGANPMSERVSPLQGNLADLPPLLVIAGTRELLLQDSERLVMQVKASGGAVESRFYHNMPHVFPLFHLLPEALEAREQIADFVLSQLIR